MIAESVENPHAAPALDDFDRSGLRVEVADSAACEHVTEEIANPLETLMSEIRSDASADPVEYLLRSNTYHDGE